jgi:hypothetical protein
MAKPQNDTPENQAATERVSAPATQQPQWVLPRQKTIERQGDISAPYSVRHPQVRGGICEWCGVMDSNQPSQYQYKLCPHYRGMQLRCTYCPQTKDSDDVIYHADLNIAEHPDNPDKLVVWCNSYECSRKHEERFKVSTS